MLRKFRNGDPPYIEAIECHVNALGRLSVPLMKPDSRDETINQKQILRLLLGYDELLAPLLKDEDKAHHVYGHGTDRSNVGWCYGVLWTANICCNTWTRTAPVRCELGRPHQNAHGKLNAPCLSSLQNR